jgi:endonuclease-3
MPVCKPLKRVLTQGARLRAQKVLRVLRHDYPEAGVTLDFSNPLELLVATILSAQSTDKKVNELTPSLFAKYPDARAYANADRRELEQAIRPSGFFHNKAKSVQECCRTLLAKHGGEVPKTMEELVELPGVGRKTANVLLAGYWHQPAIPVDTHVTRLACRLGLTRNTDPVKIEFDLQKLAPRRDWAFLSHALILHGRQICIARKPKCPECPMNRFCPSATVPKQGPGVGGRSRGALTLSGFRVD